MSEAKPMSWPVIIGVMVATAVVTGVITGALHIGQTASVGAATGVVGALLINNRRIALRKER